MAWNNNRVCPHGKRANEACAKCPKEREFYSPQRLWQAKQYALGNCINCGQVRAGSPYRKKCKACGAKPAMWARKRVGSKRWKKGGPGRPPLTEVL